MGCPRISSSQLLHRSSASMPTLIDTRKAFRQLREEGGFSDAQADAIIDIFTDVDEQVATKGDIDRLDSKIESLEDRMDQRFESMEAQMDQRFESMEAQMVQRFEAIEVEMDRRFGEVDQRFEAMDAKMDQRLESLEERMGQRIQKVRNSIVASVAAVGAVLAVVIPLSVYFFG